MKPVIVPAVIAESQRELDWALERLKGKVKLVQLDVMDGKFVSNSSLNFDFKVPPDFEYEAHLMTLTPIDWIEKNALKVSRVIVQVETVHDIAQVIKLVHDKGREVMLALNPETEVETVLPYLDETDGILILTVEPGSYCIDFLPEPLEKAKTLRSINKDIPIEVDGCMSPEHVKAAKEAGATVFASGSFIVKSDDPARSIKELKAAAK